MHSESKDNHRPAQRPEHERESGDQPEAKLKADRAHGEVEQNEPQSARHQKSTCLPRRSASLEVEPKTNTREEAESRRAEVSHPPRRKEGGRRPGQIFGADTLIGDEVAHMVEG